jgi:hypothetical protein
MANQVLEMGESIKLKTIAREILKEDAYRPNIRTSTARSLYMKLLDYLLMTGDPRYEKIKQFRRAIDKISDLHDKEELKKYFNSEFRNVGKDAWEYYK